MPLGNINKRVLLVLLLISAFQNYDFSHGQPWKALAWYVASNRELFQVEIKASRGGVVGTLSQLGESPDAKADEGGALFG